jgi:MFS family permease
MSSRTAEIAAPSGWRLYAAVLAVPRVRPLLVSSAIGRLPLGMTGLSIVLESRAEGFSYATAGLWVAAFTFGIAVFAPLVGRAVDRFGPLRLLVPIAVAFPTTATMLALAIAARPAPVLVAPLAFACGACLPPLSACVRALWPRLLGSELLAAGYSFEAIVTESAFLMGPLLAGLIGSYSAKWALISSGLLGGLGTVCFTVFLPPHTPAERLAERGRGNALGPPGVRTVILAAIAIGASFGAVEVSLPAFAEAHGNRPAAGLALAAYSVGSIAGGLLFGAAARNVPATRRYRIAVLAFPALQAVSLLAWSIPAMCMILAVAGLPIATAFAASYVLLDRLAPADVKTETFAWLNTAIVAGAALGNAAAGSLIGASGWRASLTMAVMAGVLAAAVTLVRRRTLTQPTT